MTIQLLSRAAGRVEAQVVDDDRGAFVRESPRDGRAQAAGRAGDKCSLSLQSAHERFPSCVFAMPAAQR